MRRLDRLLVLKMVCLALVRYWLSLNHLKKFFSVVSLGVVVWVLLLGCCCLAVVAWVLLLGCCCLGVVAWVLLLRFFCLCLFFCLAVYFSD